MKKVSTRLLRGTAWMSLVCALANLSACSKDSDDPTVGDGDGDGDGDTGDGDTGDGDTGDGDESCTIKENKDDTVTISCADGNSVTISTDAPEAVETCSVERNDDGTATISCPDGSETTVSTPDAEVETCMAVTEGNLVTVSCPDGSSFTSEKVSALASRFVYMLSEALVLYDAKDGKVTPTWVSDPLGVDEALGSYVISSDNKKALYIVSNSDGVANLFYVDISGTPSDPVRINGDLGDTGDVDTFAFSPDGNFVAYTADPGENDQLSLFVVDISGEEPADPVEVSGELDADSDVNRFVFSPDSSLLAYSADPDPGIDGLFLVNLADPDDGEQVNGADATAVDTVWFSFSADSKSLFYLSDEETVGHTELFVSEVGDGSPENSQVVSDTTEGTVITSFGVSPDSKWLVYQANEFDVSTNDLYLVDLGDLETAIPLYDPLADATHTSYAWSGDSKYIVWLSTLEDEAQQLLSVDIDGGDPASPVVLSPEGEGVEVPQYVFNHDATLLAFAADEDISGKFELFATTPDGEQDAIRLSGPSPQGVESTFSFAQSADVLQYTAVEAAGQVRHHLVDLSEELTGPRLDPLFGEVRPYGVAGVSEDGTVAWEVGETTGLVLTDWSGASLKTGVLIEAYPEFLH